TGWQPIVLNAALEPRRTADQHAFDRIRPDLWRLVLAAVLIDGHQHIVAAAEFRISASQPQYILPRSVESDRRHRRAGILKNDAAGPIDAHHTPNEIEDSASGIPIIGDASLQGGSPG